MFQNNNNISAVENRDVSYLDEFLLDEKGLYQAVPADVLKSFLFEDVRLWANQHAVFQLVTTELIDWLREEVGGAKALEICAGNGVISRTLGIVGTDSRIQHEKKFTEIGEQVYGNVFGRMVMTDPPKEIKKYNALQAVQTFRPHTVVGAFVTQWGPPEDRPRGIPSSKFGVKEEEMLRYIKKYIHFGNRDPHALKRIYGLPHKELEFPWLITRCGDQSLNRVWIWEQ